MLLHNIFCLILKIEGSYFTRADFNYQYQLSYSFTKINISVSYLVDKEKYLHSHS